MTLGEDAQLSSLIQLVARMRRLAFLVEVLNSIPDARVEVGGVPERAVGQVVALEVAPASFNVVQLRGVARQPLDGDPRPLGQCRPSGPAGVDGSVVSHQHNRRAVPAGLRAVARNWGKTPGLTAF